MTQDEFLKLFRRTPFVPLRVHMADGSTYDIKYPEYAAVGRNRLVIFLGGDEKVLPEDWVWCSWPHITHVAELAQAGSSAAT
jgi:hypothetical protein